MEDYKHNYVNLTAFRLFNRRDSRVQMAMESFFAFKTMSNNEINRRLFTVSDWKSCQGEVFVGFVIIESFHGIV